MKEYFTLVGGDLRCVRLAERLLQDGHTVDTMALSNQFDDRFVGTAPCFREADAVLGPVPLTLDGTYLHAPFSQEPILLSDLLAALPAKQRLIAGRIPPTFRRAAEKKGISVVDLWEREELTILNCIPTAEGAIQLALEELPITLHGAKTLVLGMGRVGRVLAHLLRNMGAEVSVCVRRPRDLAWAETESLAGCTYEDLPSVLPDCQLLYNTVPAKVLPAGLLRLVPPSCLLIDLASLPGGIDFDAAKALGLKTLHALSLPGKVAPVTAADSLAKVILRILAEEREKGGGLHA